MLAEDITITVERDGTIKVDGVTSTDGVITMVDKPLVKVTIRKTDGTDLIAGAKLSLLDSEGDTIESWTTKAGKTHEVSLEPGGSYTLTEDEAPEGFNLAADIKIEVSEEGAVTVNSQVSDDNAVTMIDTRIALGPFPNTGFGGWYWRTGAAAIAGMALLALAFKKRRPFK